MKKTLIALTLATLPVAAMAEVVLYGQIKAGYEFESTKVTDQERGPWTNGIVDYGSRIGFKGKEDLGNGLNAIWQVEQAINIGAGGSVADDNRTNQWASRDSFIGLEGGFGKVRAGYISNYQNSDMEQVDPWEYSSDALGLGRFTRVDTRRTSIRYDSPTWAGFSFAAQYSPRDNNATRTAVGGGRDVYGLGLSYENSGFFGKYAYELLKHNGRNAAIAAIPSAGGKYDGHIHRLEGGYDANNIYVAVGYQNTRNVAAYNSSVDNLPVRGQEAVITGGYRFGNVFPKISYAHGWNQKSTLENNKGTLENTKYDQIVLGAEYDFSKRTTALVSAGWLREGQGVVGNTKVNATTTAFGAGLRHKF